MSAPGEARITLDRENLKRLVAVLRDVPNRWGEVGVDASHGVREGWSMAVAAIDQIADEMPELYGDHGWPAMEIRDR